MPPPHSHNLLLQLHNDNNNNNNNNSWDTPSHNQCKHHLPTLRLHNLLHPFMLSTHHITTQPCQAFSHHRITTQPYQIFSSHHHSMVTYQPTPQSTSTPLGQPLPATPVSQQFPTTTAPTPPLRYNKHSRTRSRTTRKKHRSTTSHLTPRQQYTPPTPPDTTKTTSAPQPTQAVELIIFKKPSETFTTFVNYPCKHQFSHT